MRAVAAELALKTPVDPAFTTSVDRAFMTPVDPASATATDPTPAERAFTTPAEPPFTTSGDLGQNHAVTNADLASAFDRCADGLYRYVVVRLGGDTHRADDLMQQLWIHARKLGRTPAAELEYRLRAIARNLVRTLWREQARRPAHVPLVDRELAQDLARRLVEAELPDELLARQEVRDHLLLALTELSAADQQLIRAHYFQEQPQARIAAALGLSVRAVEGRLYRARRQLREQLRQLEPF